MQIIFRVDASYYIGSGHVIRCLNLAIELRRYGAGCIFICRELDGNLIDLIKNNNFEVKTLPIDELGIAESYRNNQNFSYRNWLVVNEYQDALDTNLILENIIADWIVIDHYGISQEWERVVRARTKKILVIDDLANRKHDCDMLLDQNLVMNSKIRYEDLIEPSSPKILGPNFALLQKQYLDLKNRVSFRENQVQNILVSFGGSDLNNLTELVSNILMQEVDDEVIVNIVTSQPSVTLLNKVEERRNFNLYSNVPSLAPFMLKADLAFGAGGTTTWERCFMGLPSIVITTADNQISIAKEMHEQGMILWLGHFSDISIYDLSNKIKEILLNSRLISSISKKCLNLLDGRGTNRVAQIMLLNESTQLVARSAKIDDLDLLLELCNNPELRSNSLFTDCADAKNPRIWLINILRSPEIHELYLIETLDSLPIGLVRFNKKFDKWETSNSLLHYAQGKNLEKNIFSTALNKFLENKNRVSLSTNLISENWASQSGLEKNFFQDEGLDGNKLSISICSYSDNWTSRFVAELIFKWIKDGHMITWVNDHNLLSDGNVCFYLSYHKLVDSTTLRKFSNNLVAHSSDLPEGKGWSPMSWQILEGKSIITVTLLEAVSELDSGAIYEKQQINLDGHELLPELLNAQSKVIYDMCDKFITNYPKSTKDFLEQVGTPTYYEKRASKDSELDINQTIKDQFNLFRIVDNEKYPAFFKIGETTYILKISKQD